MGNIDTEDEKQLDEVAAAFTQWRQTRGSARERIPADLLEMARSLTPVFNKSVICKRLKLSSSYLKQDDAKTSTARVDNDVNTRADDAEAVFSEVRFPPQAVSVAVHLPSGASVTLSNFTASSPLTLIEQLLGDALC